MKAIFNLALEQPPNERATCVAAASAGDETLEAEVLYLLQSDEASGCFLEKPIVGERFRDETHAVLDTARPPDH
jgi:hypothetical protein